MEREDPHSTETTRKSQSTMARSVRVSESLDGWGAASLRSASQRIFHTSENIFSTTASTRRSRDDEEDLKWAALEKLPTYDRLTVSLLKLDASKSGKVKHDQVDVRKIGLETRQELLDRLVHIVDNDNENFVAKLRERIDRVGITLPEVEVRYEHLNVNAEVYVGGRAMPTLINGTLNMIESILSSLKIYKGKKKSVTILNDVSGIIKPGRLTLLLGPPGAGKTTLLLALAGKLKNDLQVSGSVTYNGHTMREFVPQRTSAYISQHDLHNGDMTVRETFDFSARCQGVGHRYDVLAELARREKLHAIKPDPDIDVFMKAATTQGQRSSIVTDYTLKLLGLDICADTMVGDDMRRGISGGQKKRVTTGEMIVGPSTALFMDEISTGLDSSTTYQIVKSLKHFIKVFQTTVMISLLQPAPETFDLFDDVLLLCEGQIVYHGPRELILDFFEMMGFTCPERKGVADFLQEVTSRKDQQQYWDDKTKPYHYVPVEDFSQAFQSFYVGKQLSSALDVSYDKSMCHPAALVKKKYGISKTELFKACFDREVLLMKRSAFIYIFKAIQAIVTSFAYLMQIAFVALVTMTVFLRTEMDHSSLKGGQKYMGVIFFGLVNNMFNGLAEAQLTMMKLPVYFKQRDSLFFPAWAYSLPTFITRIPVSLIESSVWVFLTYYTIGLAPSFERFLRQLLLMFNLHQMSLSLFRFIAALGRNQIVTNTFGAFVLLVIFVLGGFIVSRDDIYSWWIWGYWTSPLMYAQNAIAVNEYLATRWNEVGEVLLKAKGMFTDESWYWIGNGVLFAYNILFNILYTLALAYLNPLGNSQASIADAEESSSEIQSSSKQMIIEKYSNLFFTSSIQPTPAEHHFDKYEMRRSCILIYILCSISGKTREVEKKGMVLPFSALSMEFDNVNYFVDMPAEMKQHGESENRLQLLHGVSGSFRPGVLTCLMGVSGAGKTTLMDVLAGRKTGGYIEGSITISGYPKKQETFARISGYCEQNDIHSPNLTIYESLLFSAWLRLPADVDDKKRVMFVNEVMDLVELNNLRDAMPELVANPSIVFMDEPTSGLDARAAAIVMRTVRNTVDTGRTVVCTIHQPSIDIFESFDEVKACLWKQHWSYWRNPQYNAVRIFFTCVCALLFASIFWKMGGKMKKQQDLQNAMGSMFAAVIFLGVSNASSVQPVVDIERSVFYRERAAGMFSALPYALSQVLMEIPYTFVQSLIYGVIVYFTLGFQGSIVKFLWFFFFMFFTFLYYTYYGMMTVALTPNASFAAVVSSAFYGVWMLFAGFLVPRTSIPIWWRWYYWGCPVAWTLYGLVTSQFGDMTTIMLTYGGDPVPVKDYLNASFGYDHDMLPVVACIIVGFAVLFAFIFAHAIRVLNFQTR
ncbi:hypothetical protein IFM89_026175 [Coptis chinensis]|uniref:ABC transporter domain-containing protein n=1 Tax=Coptis chinensis TaxID=261450 RepID=A0A835LIP8_9MAGN|nr:hypothetical protein IFM89_026175 [Coptis chinensis]